MQSLKIIFNLFQHGHLLILDSPFYCRNLDRFFTWQLGADAVRKDRTVSAIFRYRPFKKHHSRSVRAAVIACQRGRVAGIEEINYLISKFSKTISIKRSVKDGVKVEIGDYLIELMGEAGELLGYERIILNILARMSGIASATAALINSLPKNAPRLAATRKTPWMLVDKKAVYLGGGLTHRLNLADGVLVKDNHIVAVGKMLGLKSRQEVINYVLEKITKFRHSFDQTLVEIEVESQEEAVELARRCRKIVFPIVIMLDNFDQAVATETVKKIQAISAKVVIEASGNISEENVQIWAKTNVDVLSLGSLTHSAHVLDMRMEWEY